MKTSNLKQLALANDFEASQIVEVVFELIARSGIELAELMDAATPEIKDTLEAAGLSQVPTDRIDTILQPELAASTSRALLVALAEDNDASSLLNAAIEHYVVSDTRLKAGVSLRLGAVIAVLMVLASCEVEITGDNWRVHKQIVSPQQVEVISEIVSGLAKTPDQ